MGMDLNVAREMVALQSLTIGRLRDRYVEAFGECTTVRNRDWLVKRIIWKMQANVAGGLSEAARLRARELADGAKLRLIPPTASEPVRTKVVELVANDRVPPAGNTIVRKYKGRKLQVKVLDDGFVFEGVIYKTLSAVAEAITGSHCNGYLFFKLGQYGGEQ